MKHLGSLVLLLLILLSSCIAETPGTQTTCDSGHIKQVNMRFAVDDGFSPTERTALQEAVDSWRTFSSGHVDFTLSYDLDLNNGDPHIWRVESWEKIVKDADANASSPGKPFVLDGWETGTYNIFLVVDRMGPGDHLSYLATHELGHAAGLSWPYCFADKSDCHHSPDPNALMASAFANQPFGASDLQFCRASCLCP